MTMLIKICNKCEEEFLANRKNFGSTPSGNLRGTCRRCMRKHTARHTTNNPQMRKNREIKRRDAAQGFGATNDIRRKLLGRDKGICLLCNKQIRTFSSAEIDHLTPVSKGGTNNLWNLCLAHAQCNKEKHNKTLDEHKEWRRLNALHLD